MCSVPTNIVLEHGEVYFVLKIACVGCMGNELLGPENVIVLGNSYRKILHM